MTWRHSQNSSTQLETVLWLQNIESLTWSLCGITAKLGNFIEMWLICGVSTRFGWLTVRIHRTLSCFQRLLVVPLTVVEAVLGELVEVRVVQSVKVVSDVELEVGLRTQRLVPRFQRLETGDGHVFGDVVFCAFVQSIHLLKKKTIGLINISK